MANLPEQIRKQVEAAQSLVDTQYGTGKPADVVVGQSPKAGEQVPAGSSVVIFVSSGK